MTRVVGLGGKLRAGKDAVADRLVSNHGFVKIGMSDVLLERIQIVNPFIRVTIREGILLRVFPGFRRAAWLVERLGYVKAKTVEDFRRYMQKDGTDGGRNVLGENIWVEVMQRKVLALQRAGRDVVVTGLRYPNETRGAEDAGATTIWVERPSLAQGNLSSHSSENSVGPNDFHLVIVNDGTLEDLYAKVDALATAAH